MSHSAAMARQSMGTGGRRQNSLSATQIMQQLKTAGFSCDERVWTPMHLHSRFSKKNLESLYKRYEQRYLLSNFTNYLFIQTLIKIGIICLGLSLPNEYCYSNSANCISRFPAYVYQLDLSTHLVIMLSYLVLGYFVSVHEETIKKTPWTLYLLSILSVLIIQVADIVNIYFASRAEIVGHNENDNGTTVFYRSYNSYTLHSLANSRAGGFSPASSLDDPPFTDHPPHHLPVASLFNLVSVYLFLPISRKDVAVCLGMAISVITISISAISNYFIDQEFVSEGTAYGYKLAADMTFHVCVNMIGWYVRYIGDINMRRGFLDKMDCIETTIKLNYEKEQEENLLLSIIPKHIASQVGEGVSQFVNNLTNEGVTGEISATFIEMHKNVTILYADICNFTPLTEKFTGKQIVNGKEVTVDRIEDLVATLNDLFSKFDEAADKHNCLRIKILGDCYYCISGLPIPDPNDKDALPKCDPDHAKKSVEMGLDMIDLIQEVAEEHSVPVNMRIGVHTGFVLSGLIGIKKWQFDIWSDDATIANHMESSGQPGMVHITEKTKEHLGSSFKYQDVVKMEDQVVLDSGLQTYLIKKEEPVKPVKEKPKFINVGTIKEGEEDKHEPIDRQFSNDSGNETLPRASRTVMIQDKPQIRTYERVPQSGRRGSSAVQMRKGSSAGPMRRASLAGQGARRSSKMFSTEGSNSVCSDGSEDASSNRRPSMADSSLKGFQNMLDNTEKEMQKEIEQLPIRMLDRWFSLQNKKADGKETAVRNSNAQINDVFLFFKNWEWYREYLKEHDPLFKWYVLASFVILNGMGILLLLTSFNTRPHAVLWILYMVIYTFLLVLIPCTWISFIWDQFIDPDFDMENIEQPDNRLIKALYQTSGTINTSVLYRNLIFVFIGILTMLSSVLDLVITPCMLENPRNYTYRCALAIMVSFMFLRIPNIFKTLLCLLCLLFYGLIIFGFVVQDEGLQNPKTFFSSESFGYEIWTSERYQSHFTFLCGIFLYFLILDRQNEYIHLLDFQWKRQLKDEEDKARSTKKVNEMLLLNILPQHVANVYLSSDREAGQLFSESYQNVAVMFASIPNYIAFFNEGDEKKPLNILHEIISNFDQMMYEVQFARIEKIKIVGSTFMAACGLISGSEADEVDSFTKGQNARTMARFAAAMMRNLDEMDYTKFELNTVPDFKLRIGLCVGKVIAGVVGAKKPLYDIWGDTVNIAARMDYTGDRGKIHIPAATAQQLMNQDKDGLEFEETVDQPYLDPWIQCNYRGDIQVKGKGIMTTYYLELTDDLYLVENNLDRKYSDTEDHRSVSRNNSYGFGSGHEMGQNESVYSSDGARSSTANVEEMDIVKTVEPVLSIEEQLETRFKESEDNGNTEHRNFHSTDNHSSINSTRSNSNMSSCLSTDTSSVLVNLRRQEQMEDLKGVTEYDISQLREWLDCNKLESINN